MTKSLKKFIVFFSFYLLSTVVIGQTVSLEKLPELDKFTVADFFISPEGNFNLVSDAERDFRYIYEDYKDLWKKEKGDGNIFFLENGTKIYSNSLKFGRQYFNITGIDTIKIFELNNGDNFRIFKNFILLINRDGGYEISSNGGFTFEEFFFPEAMNGYELTNLKSSNSHLYVVGEREGFKNLFILNSVFELEHILEFLGINWYDVSLNNELIYTVDSGVIYSNNFWIDTLFIPIENYYYLSVYDGYLLFDDFISKSIFIMDLKSDVLRPNLIGNYKNGINFYSSIFSDHLFLLIDNQIFKVVDGELSLINNIPSSSQLKYFKISMNNNILLHSSNKLYSSNSAFIEWNLIENDILGNVESIDFDPLSEQLLIQSNNNIEKLLFRSDDLGVDLVNIGEFGSSPLKVNESTFLLVTDECGSEWTDPRSKYTVDGGVNFNFTDHSACWVSFDNKEKMLFGDSLIIYGQTYTYNSNFGSPISNDRFLDIISLETFTGLDLEVPTLIPYKENSYSFVSNNQQVYINAFACDYCVESETCAGSIFNDPLPLSPQYPSYISNDFGQTFTQVGMAPSGKLFEGPDGRGVLLINNDEDDSRLYYREYPQDDFTEINMEPSDIGKLKYIRHAEDGTMYLATRHSHIYKSNGLADFGQNVLGKIYFDKNENCIFDEGDVLIPDVMITLRNGDFEKRQYVQNGEYKMDAPLGNYEMEVSIPTHFQSCNTMNVSLSEDGEHVSYDIGFTASEMCTDATAHIGTAVLERCFDAEYTLNIHNQGSIPMENTKAIVTIDPLLELQEVGAEYIVLENNKIEITLPAIEVFDHIDIPIMVKVSCQSSLGQQHCMAVELVDNMRCSQEAVSSMECQSNIGSFDPNDIRAFSASGYEEKYFDKEEHQYYQVRFQNTGTAPARDVRVNVFVSEELDISTIEFLGASHDYKVHWKEEGILEVRFDHINLPDSTSNRVGSNGFFKYKIRPIVGIDYGASLMNEADIYFDFNDAVNTGEVETIIMEPSSTENTSNIDIHLYPNPSSEWLQIIGANIDNAKIMGLDGRVIRSSTVAENNQVDISALENGIYFIQLKTADDRVYVLKFIKM